MGQKQALPPRGAYILLAGGVGCLDAPLAGRGLRGISVLLPLRRLRVSNTDRRESRRGAENIPLAPQVFDLLAYLIRNREHVASKDDLIRAIWYGRAVSDAALTTHINAVRGASVTPVSSSGLSRRSGARASASLAPFKKTRDARPRPT